MSRDRNTLEEIVRTYFAGVDGEDLGLVFSTLASDCVFSVETHQVKLVGRPEIKMMFERLWAGHKAVCHDQFKFILIRGWSAPDMQRPQPKDQN